MQIVDYKNRPTFGVLTHHLLTACSLQVHIGCTTKPPRTTYLWSIQ